MKYDAFISYSHAADGALAPALQRGLHRLAKPWYALRALRVYRDETNLAADPGMWRRGGTSSCRGTWRWSKWNPIEPRLFSEISKNWKGRPLDSYETILNYIRTTRTATGLRVKARLVMKRYTTGVKISLAQMKTIDLRPHKVQPQRNYTLHPTT